MAIARETVTTKVRGFYDRFTAAAGDTLFVKLMEQDFSSDRVRQSPFLSNTTWHITPGASASIKVEITTRPDFSKTNTAHWVNHGEYPDARTEETIYTETSYIAALRFVVSGGNATLELASPMKFISEDASGVV